MGLCLAAAALALGAAGPGASPPRRQWTDGETPALAGIDLAGTRIDLAAYRGRVVLVHFWATWCEPCLEELPSLARLRRRLTGRPLEVLSVDFGEGEARVREFLEALRVELPVLLDRDRRTARAWGVGGLPMTFLVDAGGRVRLAALGAQDWDGGEPARELLRLLSEAEAGREPVLRATPAGARPARSREPAQPRP